MAIAFDNSNKYSGAGSGAATVTVSYTLGSITSGVVVVGVYSSALSGITYNGVAMTLIGKAFFNGVSFWYVLTSSTSGAHNLILSSTSTFAFNPNIVVGSYSGVGAIDNSVTQEDGGINSATITLTTVADNCWLTMVGMGDNGGGSIGAGAGTTSRQDNPLIGLLDSNAVIHPAGSASLVYTQNNGSHMYGVMASFAPGTQSGGGGGSIATGIGSLLTLGVGS